MGLQLLDKQIVYLRQSWLKDYFDCPEKARLIRGDLYPPDETDAAAAGTAAHAAIEAVVMRCAEPSEAIQVGVDTFRKIATLPGFRWVKVKTEKTALAHVEGGFYSWYNHVYPTLGSTIWCEHSFEFVLHEDERRQIVMRGTADYADAYGLKDWKLSGNKDKYGRDSWQLKRWDVQSTVYAAAAYEHGLYPRDVAVPFQFVNLDFRGGKPQVVDVSRDVRHVEFLREQAISVADMLAADLPRWPLRDQHALCSPTWCLNWQDCKGRYVT